MRCSKSLGANRLIGLTVLRLTQAVAAGPTAADGSTGIAVFIGDSGATLNRSCSCNEICISAAYAKKIEEVEACSARLYTSRIAVKIRLVKISRAGLESVWTKYDRKICGVARQYLPSIVENTEERASSEQALRI